jgi:glycosyltransferase involved in cell wall biosynthesis
VATPELSVIVPVRLAGGSAGMRRAFLRLCLVALDVQTVGDDTFEVVLVDDASDLPLVDTLNDLDADLAHMPRVVRTSAPVGVAEAYNVGTAAARGTYVLLTSDDSILRHDAIEAHLAAHAVRTEPAYVCGVERQYVYGILFRDITTGELHPPGDLSVRTLGRLMGFGDFRQAAEYLEMTTWTITPDDVRHDFDRLSRLATLTPTFRDMYAELRSDRTDLRWLCVRMGNHSVARDALLAAGGLDADLRSWNSDQDLGLRFEAAGIEIVHEPRAESVLIEHRRDPRSFADVASLQRLVDRWPQRPDVENLELYFSQGLARSIGAYRRTFSDAAHPSTDTPRSSSARRPFAASRRSLR